jgi:[citrate (pro-3S)-lyase] ligase
MYCFDTFTAEIILPSMPIRRLEVETFLKRQGLDFESDIEYSVALRHEDDIVATGSYSKNVLKCIAIDKNYQGMGLSEKIVSLLVEKKRMAGEDHLFLFTKTENEQMFEDMNFHKIASSKQGAILMETPKTALKKYIEQLKSYKKPGKVIGSIVANCNPFTLGHLYLMEYAAKRCDVLYVFVVSENASAFPANIRYELVKKGTAHIPNIVVLRSGPYIISSATFPTYFLKDKMIGSSIHTEIDVDLFASYIAPSLGITKRFVGTEPNCKTTLAYNTSLLAQLPPRGIEVEVIQRLKKEKQEISATTVRNLAMQGDLEHLKDYVPKTTYEFLTSNEGKDIVNNLIKTTR